MVKRIPLVLLGVVVATLLLSAAALAWTPQDIYDDFSANGQLTRDYTDDELKAYLNDATVAAYANQSVKGRLDNTVSQLINRDTFPFTGFQIMLAVVVVVVLIGGGVALRLFTRPRKRSQES